MINIYLLNVLLIAVNQKTQKNSFNGFYDIEIIFNGHNIESKSISQTEFNNLDFLGENHQYYEC